MNYSIVNTEREMVVSQGRKQKIFLESDVHAIVRHGATTVELKANGSVIVKINGNTTLRSNADLRALPAAKHDNAAATAARPKPGERMPDGTVYAGISPDTGKPMFTTPRDAPLTMKWKAAMRYAKKLVAHDHRDWRAPTKSELNVLFENRAAIRGFDESGLNPAGRYWSSLQVSHLAWAQHFSDGAQDINGTRVNSSLRCVR